MAGYHRRQIKKGVLGEISKIREELEELEDAHDQGVKILEICELADMIGAVQAMLAKHHPSISIIDLEAMAALTAKAFNDGSRK